MAKRKTRRKSTKTKHTKSQNINFKLINILLLIILALIIAIAVLIYLIDNNKIEESKKEISNIEKKIKKDITKIQETSEDKLNKYVKNIEVKKDKFEEYTEDLYKEYIHEKTKDTTKKTEDKKLNKETKKEDDIQTEEIPVFHKTLPFKTNKPKLAIVIDDVTTQYQINRINSIGYKATMSILPPTSRNGSTIEMVNSLPFYMIHFPMEAKFFKGEEQGTLHIKDSYEKIEKRVAQIRNWYPTAKFTNNHTGSKFTQDTQAMDKLFKALTKYNFTFVDSRTTSKSKGKIMAKKYKMPYIARNIFLDNEQKFGYIQNQLKKAIRIAKKRGYAIAIGHPHDITLKVLKESKPLLKDLELIYINQLPIL
ncbi:MAG: divergent polysaccharide deacetylase family protein [Campylobacteraceae bacterium]|nr:divergent polysaccharide deacetylase family protein [Campylobacteraceae bacterium]